MLIEVIDLCKSSPQNGPDPLILRNLHFSLGVGDFVGIVGPSGAGKSTLLAILSGLIPLSSGQVLIAGQSISGLSSAERSQLRSRTIGLILTQPILLEGLNVLENVLLPLQYRLDLSRRDAVDLAMGVLTRAGVVDQTFSSPNRLNQAQKQRVSIARALVTEPQLILADDPCAQLDQQSAQEVLALFQELSLQGTSILMTTRNPEEAQYCKRTLTLDQGYLSDDQETEKFEIASSNASVGLGVQPASWNQIRLLSEKPSRGEWVSIKEIFSGLREPIEVEKSLRYIHRYCAEDYAKNDIIQLIRSKMGESNWRIRFAMVRLLWEWMQKNRKDTSKNTELKEIVLRVLDDPTTDLKHIGMRVLLVMPALLSQEYLSTLVQENRKSPDARVRADVASLCGLLKYASVEAVLNELLKDPDERVRSNALTTLWKIHEKESRSKESLVQLTLGYLNDVSHRLIADAVVLAHPHATDSCNQALENLLQHQSPQFVASGIYAASLVNITVLQSKLPELLNHPSERVQSALSRFVSDFISEVS